MEGIDDLIFEDGEFQASLARKVLSYLSSRQRTGYTTSGLYYSYHQADDPKGLVTIVHGFSEGMYKYREMVYYLVRLGYSCLAYESRGHARSIRSTDDGSSVHIDTFETYVEDLRSITEELAIRMASGRPMHLFGHSMGGCVSALFCQEHPSYYDSLVLSSPMLGLKVKGPSGALAKGVADLMCRIGRGEEQVHLGGAKERFETSASTSRERWQYYRSVREDNVLLKMNDPTWSWVRSAIEASRTAVRNAPRIGVPVLLLTAQDDSLVDNGMAERFARCNPLVTAVQVPGSRHEIMSSPKAVLIDYYSRIVSFLDGLRNDVDRP